MLDERKAIASKSRRILGWCVSVASWNNSVESISAKLSNPTGDLRLEGDIVRFQTGSGGFYDAAGDLNLRNYTNATRPTPGSAGRVIFNSDDQAPNYDDGTNWRDSQGVLT